MSESPLLGLYNRLVGQDPMRRFMTAWGLVFAVILLVTMFIGKQLMGQMGKVQSDMAAMSPLIAKIQAMQITSENQEAKARELQEEVMKEAQNLIKTEQISNISSTISNYLHAYGVTLKQINSASQNRPVNGFDSYVQVPIVMKLEGEYQKVGDFIGVLEKELHHLFTWEKIRFYVGTVPDGVISVEIEMNFYARKKV